MVIGDGGELKWGSGNVVESTVARRYAKLN